MANKGFYVDIENVEQEIKRIRLYEIEKRENVKGIIKKSAQKVNREAKKRAPVLSGDTKASIKTKYYENGLFATVRPRLPKGWKAHFHEYGTVKMRARPFMTPAEETTRPQYLSDLQQEVRK